MEVAVMLSGEYAEMRSKSSRDMGQRRMKTGCNKSVTNCL